MLAAKKPYVGVHTMQTNIHMFVCACVCVCVCVCVCLWCVVNACMQLTDTIDLHLSVCNYW